MEDAEANVDDSEAKTLVTEESKVEMMVEEPVGRPLERLYATSVNLGIPPN